MNRLTLDHRTVMTWFEGRFNGDFVSAEESARMREHLAGCPECRSACDRTVVMLRVAAGIDPGTPTRLESRLLFEETMVRLPQQDAPARFPLLRFVQGLLLPAAVAAAALVLLLPARPLHDPRPPAGIEDTMPRGAAPRLPDAGLGVSGVAADGAEYEAIASDGVCLCEALRFYVTARRPDLSYYFLFGIQGGRPLWYFPTPEEGGSPALPPKERMAWMVPYEIELAQRHRPGPLTLVLLLSPTPLAAKEVAEWVERGGATAAPDGLGAAAQARFGDSVAAASVRVTLMDCGGTP